MAKELSEKSLELNICSELLHRIRSWPGCEKALWLGLTQAQERLYGADELLKLGGGALFMLQFKAPWANSRVDDLYRFYVNERQHKALEHLAVNNPDAVFYVFPLYSTWDKAEAHSPDLVRDTWLVRVSSIPLATLTSQSTPKTGLHRVHLRRSNSSVTATFHSPVVVNEAINADNFFGPRNVDQIADTNPSDTLPVGVPANEVMGWVQEWGQVRFRGLNAMFIPTASPLQ